MCLKKREFFLPRKRDTEKNNQENVSFFNHERFMKTQEAKCLKKREYFPIQKGVKIYLHPKDFFLVEKT